MAKQLPRTDVDGTFLCTCGQSWQHVGGKCGLCGARMSLAKVFDTKTKQKAVAR